MSRYIQTEVRQNLEQRGSEGGTGAPTSCKQSHYAGSLRSGGHAEQEAGTKQTCSNGAQQGRSTGLTGPNWTMTQIANSLQVLERIGGDDETRTRDLCRDRLGVFVFSATYVLNGGCQVAARNQKRTGAVGRIVGRKSKRNASLLGLRSHLSGFDCRTPQAGCLELGKSRALSPSSPRRSTACTSCRSRRDTVYSDRPRSIAGELAGFQHLAAGVRSAR